MKKTYVVLLFALLYFTATAQNVSINNRLGIGVSNPLTRLHVADSSVLFTTDITAASVLIDPPVTGPGSRLMYYANKGAFRMGHTMGAHWDRDSTGVYSFASGFNPVARGDYSFATGYEGRSYGFASFTMGSQTEASGDHSFAAGLQSNASGVAGTAIGYGAHASGGISTAIGWFTRAKTAGGISLGISNDNADNPDPINFNPSDRIFQLGNGNEDGSVRSNAITVLRNGNTGIGNLTPTEKLDVAGNINLTGQLKFNNNSGTADQVLTSAGAASAPVWKNTNKYVFAQGGTSIILNGGFQSMPIVDGQTFTLDFPAIVKVTVSAVGTVDAGETIVQEPRFFFRIRQGATIITSGAEGYCYIKPQPATYVSNTMTVTRYFPGLAAGTYNLECKATTLSAGGTCYLSSSQAMIEIIPQ